MYLSVFLWFHQRVLVILKRIHPILHRQSTSKISFFDVINCYRKLLTPPIAPCDQNVPVGRATATLDDLQQIMPVCKIVYFIYLYMR